MRIFSVTLSPKSPSSEPRQIDVRFTYPWKRTRFRGKDLLVKTAIVSFGQLKRPATKEQPKPAYKFYGYGEVKWPIGTAQMKDKEGRPLVDMGGKPIPDTEHTRLLSPRLSQPARELIKSVAKVIPSNFKITVTNVLRLSKAEASKQALKIALIQATKHKLVNYEDRYKIWEAFHKEFKTGVVPPYTPQVVSPVVTIPAGGMNVLMPTTPTIH